MSDDEIMSVLQDLPLPDFLGDDLIAEVEKRADATDLSENEMWKQLSKRIMPSTVAVFLLSNPAFAAVADKESLLTSHQCTECLYDTDSQKKLPPNLRINGIHAAYKSAQGTWFPFTNTLDGRSVCIARREVRQLKGGEMAVFGYLQRPLHTLDFVEGGHPLSVKPSNARLMPEPVLEAEGVGDGWAIDISYSHKAKPNGEPDVGDAFVDGTKERPMRYDLRYCPASQKMRCPKIEKKGFQHQQSAAVYMMVCIFALVHKDGGRSNPFAWKEHTCRVWRDLQRMEEMDAEAHAQWMGLYPEKRGRKQGSRNKNKNKKESSGAAEAIEAIEAELWSRPLQANRSAPSLKGKRPDGPSQKEEMQEPPTNSQYVSRHLGSSNVNFKDEATCRSVRRKYERVTSLVQLSANAVHALADAA